MSRHIPVVENNNKEGISKVRHMRVCVLDEEKWRENGRVFKIRESDKALKRARVWIQSITRNGEGTVCDDLPTPAIEPTDFAAVDIIHGVPSSWGGC